jgi:hypothetical protein
VFGTLFFLILWLRARRPMKKVELLNNPGKADREDRLIIEKITKQVAVSRDMKQAKRAIERLIRYIWGRE